MHRHTHKILESLTLKFQLSMMSPDLNSLSLDEKIDYSQPGSSGYNIRQDATWMDPKNRRLKVLSIGAGVSGILMAYQIQKYGAVL